MRREPAPLVLHYHSGGVLVNDDLDSRLGDGGVVAAEQVERRAALGILRMLFQLLQIRFTTLKSNKR